MTHPSLHPSSAPEDEKSFGTLQRELRITRLQLLGQFHLTGSHLLQDSDVSFILHEKDALKCPCVQVYKLSGDFIFAFQGTLSVKEIWEQVSSRLQVDVGQISLVANGEPIVDENRLLNAENLLHACGSSSLTTYINGREKSQSSNARDKALGEKKFCSKRCTKCGEQGYFFEHSLTPRCSCGWW